MGVSSGPNFVSSGCVLSVDASNRKSYLNSAGNQQSFIDVQNWVVSNDGVGNYSANGSTGENARLNDTNPWGNTNIVWGSYASGNGNDDGGWNNGYYSIDRNKMYRLSVWIRRTSSTSGGTFYFGAYGNGPTWGLAHMSDGTVNGNPYWECVGTGTLTQNQWYLIVGHIYPYNTSNTGRHPDTGYYTRSGGSTVKAMNIGGCNIGSGDLKWLSDTTSVLHRTYHYYCGDSTTRLQWAAPRIDLVDGTEPSIQELLDGSFTEMVDTANKTASQTKTFANIVGNPTFASDRKSLTFNGGGGQYVNVYRLDLNGGSFAYSQITAIAWIYIDPSSSTGENNIATVESAFEYRWNNNNNGTASVWYASNPWAWYGSGTVSTGVWQMLTFRHSASTGEIWSNTTQVFSQAISGGIGAGTSSYPMLTLMGRTGGPGSPAKGKLGAFYLYNRALTDAEIKQNFYATRSKYGV